MTASNFRTALDFIWGPTRDGHKHDSAPGESFHTAWGVTQMTWHAACEDGIVEGDLADATQEQCAAIYRVRYWNALHCSSLPDGVDLLAFNDATLTGTGRTARMIQRIVGARQDGAIGPETLRKVGSYGAKNMIDAMVRADLNYLTALAKAPLFIHGWTRREKECQALAYRLARIPSG